MENPRGSVSEPPEGWAWGASEGGTQHYDVDTRLAGDDVKEDIRLHPAAALLYSFPEGDVRVGHKKRKTHTLGPSLPAEALGLLKSDSYLRDCIGLFTQDWTTVKRRYRERNRRDERVRSRRLLSPEAEAGLPPQTFESFDSPSSRIPSGPAANTEELDVGKKGKKKKGKKEKKKKGNRSCGAAEEATESSEEVALRQYFAKTADLSLHPRNYFARDTYTGVQLLVTPRKISFALGNFEPFYGVLALYDMAKKVKISENFYFDVNDDDVSKLTLSGSSQAERASKKALFRVAKPSADVYLVLRIEKVLQGDPEDSLDLYGKCDSIKEKDRERLEAHTKECCKRFGEYRQGMGWSVLPLFGQDGQLAVPETATFQPVYRYRPEASDAQFFASWGDQSKAGSKRLKTLPGNCVVEITEVAEGAKPPGRLTPSLIPLKPACPADDKQTVLEIEEFGGLRGDGVATDYVNNLYIYPELVNGAASGRNLAIRVQLLNSDRDPDAPSPLPCICTRSGELASDAVTLVSYHAKNPSYYDEFKICLPPTITPAHHLLFTLYHIPVQIAKNKDVAPERKVIGYAWLPLFVDGRMAGEDHQVPLAANIAPAYLSPEGSSHIRWLDGGKASLRLKLQLVSSLYTQDHALGEFFAYSVPPASPDALVHTLNALTAVPPRKLAWFLPLMLNLLFRLACVGTLTTQRHAFATILTILNIISTEMDIGAVLDSYASYVVCPAEIERNSKVYLHHQIAKHWAFFFARASNADAPKEELYKFAGFLFKLIYRSMVLKLHSTGELKDEESTSRRGRFDPQFEAELRSLITGHTRVLQAGLRVGLTNAKLLSQVLALALHDLMSVMDRGVVLHLADLIAANMVPPSGESVFHGLRLTFLDILAEYEHLLPLSLPLPPEVRSIVSLPTDWREQHLPMALLLDYSSQYLLHDEIQLADERYACPEYVPRLAGLFLPFLPFLLPHAKALRERYLHERREILLVWLWLLDSIPHVHLRSWWQKETRSRLLFFFDALLLALDTFNARLPPPSHLLPRSPRILSPSIWAPSITLATMYVGKETIEEKIAEGKIAAASTNATKALLESFYTEVGSTSRVGAAGRRTYTSLREKRVAARAQGQAAKEGDQRHFRATLEKRHTTQVSSEPKYLFSPLIEKNLSVQVQRVVVATIGEFMSCFKTELFGPAGSGLMAKLFEVLKCLLQRNQAVDQVGCVYGVGGEPRQGPVLPQHQLRGRDLPAAHHALSLPAHALRRHAAAFLALLMKQNYDEVRKNFTRVKVQVTIALSALVGRGIRDDQYLMDALQFMTKAARHLEAQDHAEVPRPFAAQVEDLAGRLHTILRDSVKINQHANDPEMMADLYFRISKSYANTPDLRITWLINLANFHALRLNWAEAGQCALHMGALISEYLALKRGAPDATQVALPKNCHAFLGISPNVVEEALTEISMVGGGEEGMCESQLFSDRGLVSVLLDAVDYFKKGALYEIAVEARTLPPVYKIILPAHEAARDYRALSRAHADLQAIYQDIASANELQSRMLGSFYRVGFFGAGFDELDGQEFIYKEPKITRLGEITERLLEQFGERLGSERVRLWTSQGEVEREKLDPALCYIQITSVDAYFTPEEAQSRVTYFERYNNLQRFIFETPFTVGGGGQAGHVRDQWKRKTILTAENHFPYVKKRIPVRHKQETCLSPIANAVETIEGRAAAITAELQAEPSPNPNSLQGLLQGALLLQVHAGPREICKTFLVDDDEGACAYADADKLKLRVAFKALVEACGRALQTNSELIDAEGLALHEEMQRGFLELTHILAPVLHPAPTGASSSTS
ncbi:Dedicator of cytokinesis [Acanthamoeba castellanii str. Neff]|uniref:Dedicator of cytokinesis n=1 Tax=Acanthamoeba castellanii (strain ATCC 30010 / Neff) TaxID=1257118 RepID=L8GU77_ACACF|nr:Dedicator of cytokinesis [Acanthamoeba castellanii str. Neff]ELR16168.1 Dedicator of cytokinesis [Acanthamoeba castellanii str. Neff]